MSLPAPCRPLAAGRRAAGLDPTAELLMAPGPGPARGAPAWSFLTNHARVLACLAADPAATMRAVALRVGVTERRVQQVVAELAAGGYLTATRAGRENRYVIHRKRPLGHPMESHLTAGDLIDLAGPPGW